MRATTLWKLFAKKLETANYVALGATKEDRALAVLAQVGITVLPPEEIL